MHASPDDVRQQLDRLLTSQGFTNAERMSGFLRYVVDRTLAGEGDQVKEYVIGVEVFGRDDRYDPRLDSIVRVEARRLRSKIEEYYAGEGATDPVVIRMRRGSYVPVFERRDEAAAVVPAAVEPPVMAAPAAKRSRWGIGLALAVVALGLLAVAGLWTRPARPAPAVTVAVLPFSQYSTDPADALLAARLTDGVTSEMARLGTVGVVSHTNAQQFAGARPSIEEIARTLHANLVIEGTVSRDGDTVRVDARLVDPTLGRKFWADSFTGPTSNIAGLQRQVAVAIAAKAETGKAR